MMNLPGTDWLRPFVRRLWSRRPPRALVLMYHRVAEVRSDPWGLCVSPARFAEHLEVLQRRGPCLRLEELVEALRNGQLPRRALVLTFDDGYADNYHHAKPLLERYGVPATFFLTTGLLGSQREFWWDELDRLILQPGRLPERLRLTVEGKVRTWSLGEAACYSEEARRRHGAWRAWEEAPTKRHALYCSLWEALYALPDDRRQHVLSALRTWAGAPEGGRRTHRVLSAREAIALAQGRHIEVGAHTVTHPPLALLSAASQRSEIQQSKAQLEQLLDRPVASFSYPHGRHAPETRSLVRQAGFASACTTAPVPVQPAADAFQLPRVQVQNWKGEVFDEQLSTWLAASE